MTNENQLFRESHRRVMNCIPLFEAIQNRQNAAFGLPEICCFNDRITQAVQHSIANAYELSDDEHDLAQDLWVKYGTEGNESGLDALSSIMDNLQFGSNTEQKAAYKQLKALLKDVSTVQVKRPGMQSEKTLKDVGGEKQNPNKWEWYQTKAAIQDQEQRTKEVADDLDWIAKRRKNGSYRDKQALDRMVSDEWDATYGGKTELPDYLDVKKRVIKSPNQSFQ